MNNIPYTILPFQFKRLSCNEVLLVNECGDFLFINNDDFITFINYRLSNNSSIFFKLKSHLFLATNDISIAIRQTAARYSSRKAFLRDFTMLHMMVITLRCNQKCEYCQVSCADEDAKKFDMSKNTAKKIIDIIFQAPSSNIKIEFQGGEPTLNWDTLTSAVEYAEQQAQKQNKNIEFVICTNLTNIKENNLFFCKDHNINISTSLDGPNNLHNSCRKIKNGKGTYEKFIEKLSLTRSILGFDKVNALMTTTSRNINNIIEVIDEYIKNGFQGIFIRSLNPYGFAAEKKNELSYDTDLFVKKYFEALDYIIEINKKIFFQEYFASLLLARILTPFSTGFVDLQSPAGAGISGAIYDYDGSVYPADEARMLARMGDNHFCLGNVNTNTYQEIFTGNKLKQIIKHSCVETTIPCAWCAFQTYCGCDPIRNYLETGREERNMITSSFCIKNKAILEGLFDRIKKADSITKDIFWSWLTCNKNLVNRNA